MEQAWAAGRRHNKIRRAEKAKQKEVLMGRR